MAISDRNHDDVPYDWEFSTDPDQDPHAGPFDWEEGIPEPPFAKLDVCLTLKRVWREYDEEWQERSMRFGKTYYYNGPMFSHSKLNCYTIEEEPRPVEPVTVLEFDGGPSNFEALVIGADFQLYRYLYNSWSYSGTLYEPPDSGEEMEWTPAKVLDYKVGPKEGLF